MLFLRLLIRLRGYLLSSVWFWLLALTLCFLNFALRSLISSYMFWGHLIWRAMSWSCDRVVGAPFFPLVWRPWLRCTQHLTWCDRYILFSFPFPSPFFPLNNSLSKHGGMVVSYFPFWFLVCIQLLEHIVLGFFLFALACCI